MTSRQVLVHCGPKPASSAAEFLDPSRPDGNVVLNLSGVEHGSPLPLQPVVRDFLEIASYVLLADGAVSRGRRDQPLAGDWRRDLLLSIPVQEPQRWAQSGVTDLLSELLGFATDDSWSFDFRPSEPKEQLTLSLTDNAAEPPTVVSLFSGGLDSLAGALELSRGGARPILVTHVASEVVYSGEQAVLSRLRAAIPGWRFPNHVLHTVRRHGQAAEYTQRSRGFLYLALATGVAMQAGIDRVVVPENGVTSLNLAQSAQSVGAMRSRTTHPKAIGLFRRLLAQLRIPVEIATPFLGLTKTDVIERALALGSPALVHATVSCARTMFRSANLPHCGRCSQCIDRRFAGIAAGWNDEDERTSYELDLFRDSLPAGDAATYAEHYLRFATDVAGQTADNFVARHGEVWDALAYEDDRRSSLEGWYRLEQRHAEQVFGAYTSAYLANQKDILAGRLPTDGLFARIGRGEQLLAPWQVLAQRIIGNLEPALRKTFVGRRPTLEQEVHRAIDAMLTAAGEELVREGPTLPFHLVGVSSKPDFSKGFELFVEVKLIRKVSDRRRALNEMLADVALYKPSGAAVLFLVWDAGDFIADDSAFARPIEEAGSNVRVGVLR